MPPETRYAKSGDINIAYQVIGTGAVDLVFVMGWASHLDWSWQEPSFARFLRRLVSFSRLIVFDKRGTGFSDRSAGLANFEQRMDDVRAVMDAAGSARAALLGVSEGAAMCALFAATYPERTSALITSAASRDDRGRQITPGAPLKRSAGAFWTKSSAVGAGQSRWPDGRRASLLTNSSGSGGRRSCV